MRYSSIEYDTRVTLPLDLIASTLTPPSSLVSETCVPPHGHPWPPTQTTRTQPVPHSLGSLGRELGGQTAPNSDASTVITFVATVRDGEG